MLRRSPFDDLFYVFRDFDSFFRPSFSDLAPALGESGRLLPSGESCEITHAPASGSVWPTFSRLRDFPMVESFARDGRLHIRAELPGVDPSELQVSITGDTLQISGEKKTAREVNEADVFLREISHGRFERAFTLPEGVKSDQVKARYENGVLELTMPAPEGEQPRKVQIEVTPSGKLPMAA